MSRRGHGEGSIHKRADGRWCAIMSVEGGRRKYFYAETRHKVQQKLTKALLDQQQGLPPMPERLTVTQFLDRWLETVNTSVRPRTYEAYALNVRRLAPHIGQKKLAALSPADLQSCYASLMEQGLSRRSVEQCHTVLHGALRQAMLWGLISRNATEAVTAPRPEHKEMSTLSAEQVRRLFEATAGNRLHAFWVLLATTGLRLGEATGLRWDDLDLFTGRLVVRRSLQRQRGAGLVFVEPKTSRSRRTVHLAEGAASALREHRKRQKAEFEALDLDWQESGLVFTKETGGPLDDWAARVAFKQALKVAGLPNLRIHDLRHTAATLLLQKGIHPKVVQEMLGHSTISITLDLYSHVVPALHQEAAKQMEYLF